MKIFKTISIYLVLLSFAFPFILNAQNTTGNPPIPVLIQNPTTAGNSLIEVLYAILKNIIMPIAVVFVVVWIIWAGFSYVTARGNPAAIQKAHQRLLWSLVGAGILLGAAAISGVVQNTIKALLP